MTKTKSLPHSLETEQSVLGAILYDPERAFGKVKEIISPDDFYIKSNKIIFKAMLDVTTRGNPLDTLTLVEELKRTGRLEQVGGAYFITGLQESVPTSGNVVHHANLIRELSVKRKFKQISYRAYQDDKLNVSTLLDGLKSDVNELIKELPENGKIPQGVSLSHIKRIHEYSEDYREEYAYQERRFNLGIPPIDNKIRFVAPGQVISVMASTGTGKTLFLQSRIMHYVKYSGESAVLFELEQPGSEIFERGAQMIFDEWGGNIESRFFDGGEGEQIVEGVKAECENFFVIDRPGLGWDEIKEYCQLIEQDVIKKPLGLVAVDYLGLLKSDGKGSLYELTTHLAYGMKQTARELDVPVMVAVQVTGTNSSTETITLGSARDSKTIVHASDYVLGLTRVPDEDGKPMDILNINLLKCRRGGTCMARMCFDPKSIRLTVEE